MWVFCGKFVNMWKKGNQKDMLYIKLGFEVQFGSFVKVKKREREGFVSVSGSKSISVSSLL